MRRGDGVMPSAARVFDLNLCRPAPPTLSLGRDAVLLSSTGLHERGHDHCRQNKNYDDGECFKGVHCADLRQASHLP